MVSAYQFGISLALTKKISLMAIRGAYQIAIGADGQRENTADQRY